MSTVYNRLPLLLPGDSNYRSQSTNFHSALVVVDALCQPRFDAISPSLKETVTLVSQTYDENLIGRISRRQKLIRRGHCASLSVARTHGIDLIALKAAAPVGQLQPLMRQAGLSLRQAQKYMKLAREWDRLKAASDADLTLDQALGYKPRPAGVAQPRTGWMRRLASGLCRWAVR